jgi:hypothetical protein
MELSSEAGKYSYDLDEVSGSNRERLSDCERTWGMPMRRFVRSPELLDAHSDMCSEHNSQAFSRVVGQAAVGSLSSNTERTSLISVNGQTLREEGAAEQTEYFGGGGDVLADDSHAVEAICKRYHAPSLWIGRQQRLFRQRAIGQNTYLLISPYEGLSPTTPQ